MADDTYGRVSTESQNELLAFVERFGPHEVQYAMVLSTVIGMGKALGLDRNQIIADVRANWKNVPTPDVVREH